MRNALLVAVAVAAAGCNLTYDREGVKFTPPVTPDTCAALGQSYCDPYLTAAGYCADLLADENNCGTCRTLCAVTATCSGGTCVGGTCGVTPGEQACGPAEHPYCANTLTDPNDCGTCGQVCASGVCNAGVCAITCGGTTPDICGTGASAFCTDLASDVNNCGTCGKACVATCTAGACDAGLVALEVLPAYPLNGKDWNDYVQQDSVTGAATDVACDPAGTAWCAFGAELKTVTVPGRIDCAGLTMTDALDAFQWSCAVDPPPATTVRFTSSRKPSAPVKGLLDLVDVAGGAWKRNAVTLYLDGAPYGVSSWTAWWANPIVKGIPAGGVLGSTRTIYVADGLYSGPFPIQLAASKVALVVPAGTVAAPTSAVASLVTADSNAPPAAPRDYLWIEGSFDPGAAAVGIALHNVRRSALWNVLVSRASAKAGSSAVLIDNVSSHNYLQGVSTLGSDYGIQLSGAGTTFNFIDEARVEGAATYGIDLFSADTTFLLRTVVKGRGLGTACVHLQDAASNLVMLLDASSCGAGIYVEGLGSTNNSFKDVRIAACLNEGVILLDGSANRFDGLVSVQNQGDGVTVQGASGNVFSDVVVAANGRRGFGMGTVKDTVVASLTAARNAGTALELNYASNNVFTALALDGAGATRALALGSSSSNTFAYVAATTGGTTGGYVLYEDATSLDNGFFGELRVDTADTCQTTSPKPSFLSGAAAAPSGCRQAGVRSVYVEATIQGLFDPANPPFVGVTTDSVNKTWTGSPTRITSLDDPAVDWTGFDHPHRGWMRAASAVGPLGCSVPGTRDEASCGGTWAGDADIYDWAVRATETGLAGIPLPTEPTVQHMWSAPAPVVFDPSARELMGDGLGNEDGLCDAPPMTPQEQCLYTPNFGAYQGEGALGPAKPGTIPDEFYRAYEIPAR